MWKDILLRVLDGKKNIPSPFHKEGEIKYVFVVLDEESRMGYLWMWCSKTYRGMHMSRLRVPDNVEYVKSGEAYIPDFHKIKFEPWT